MKKFIFLVPCFISIICLSLFLFLFLGPSNPNANYNQNSQTGSDSSDNQTPDSSVVFYQIIIPENNDYKVSLSKSSAVVGEIIYVKIDLINTKINIKEVYANNIKCKIIENNYYDYCFNMPNENVTLNVKSENINDEIKENKILWDENNADFLTKSTENDSDTLKFNFLYPIEITSIQKQISVVSTNQECIPNISIFDISLTFSNNGLVCGISLKINLLLINEGTTQIVINILSTDSELFSNNFNLQVKDDESFAQKNEIKIRLNFESVISYPITIDLYNLNSGEYFNYQIFDDNYSITIKAGIGESFIFDIYYFENGKLISLNIEDQINDFFCIISNEIKLLQNNIIINLNVYNEK